MLQNETMNNAENGKQQKINAEPPNTNASKVMPFEIRPSPLGNKTPREPWRSNVIPHGIM